MGKGGKLTKLKSVLRKWQSFGRNNTSSIAAGNPADDDDEDSVAVAVAVGGKIGGGFQPVYVGKSRRRYLISSDVIDHPLFRELVEKSDQGSDSMRVGCEVVLFEHMLWMLEHADPQPESLDDLVDFYACSS